MARSHNMFEFTGSIANLIFYYYRGKLCVRTRRPEPMHLLHQYHDSKYGHSLLERSTVQRSRGSYLDSIQIGGWKIDIQKYLYGMLLVT